MINFLIGGAQKAGTSAFHYHLRQHPEVYMPPTKELHFFDHDEIFNGAIIDYENYKDKFAEAGATHIARGEATPIYFFWKEAPERVFNFDRKMRWVILLRNPILRAYSQWNMEHSRNYETLDFRNAVEAELVNWADPSRKQCRIRSYLERGRYAEQILRLQSFFPPEQILFIKYEEFRQHPSESLTQTCAFLDVSPFAPVEHKIIHQIEYKEPLQRTDWEWLMQIMGSEIDAVESLLGWNCGDWRKPPSA